MFRTFLVWVHVLAAAAWVGGMISFVALLMPWVRTGSGDCVDERRAQMRVFGHQFRLYAWVCLGTLLATGVAMAQPLWAGGPASMRRLLMGKATVLLIAIALNACESRIVSRSVSRWAGRFSLVLGLVALLLAVTLVRPW